MPSKQGEAEARTPTEATPSGASLTIVSAPASAAPLVVTQPIDDFVDAHFVGTADLAGWTCT